MTTDTSTPAAPRTAAPSRGRTPLKKDIPPADAMASAVETAAAPLVEQLRGEALTLHKGELGQSLVMAQGMGMFQTLNYLQSFSGLARLKWLAERKDRGDYKGATVMHGGQLITLKTFEDLCDYVGHSRKKIYEDLQNLAIFGEGLLAAQEALGLGYRELRRLKAGIKSLPLDEQQKVLADVQAVEGEGEAQAMLDELRVKLAQAEAEKKDLQEDIAAKDKVAKAKNERLDNLQEQVIRLTSVAPDEQEAARREMAREARRGLDVACHEAMGHMNTVLAAAQAILRSDDMDSGTHLFVHQRVALMCDLMAEALLLAGVDVDLRTRFTVDYGPEGDPAMMELADEDGE